MKTEEINEEGAGGRTNKVVFGGGYVRRTKKTKTNKGEEEGGNKYTKVIFFSITVDMWSLWREEERESERDEHKVLWVLLLSKRRVE